MNIARENCSCAKIRKLLIDKKENEAMMLFTKRECEHFLNVVLIAMDYKSSADCLSNIFKQIDAFYNNFFVIPRISLYYLFSKAIETPDYLKIFLSRYICPDILGLIYKMLDETDFPEESFDMLLKESLFDCITTIEYNNFGSCKSGEKYWRFTDLTPIQYLLHKILFIHKDRYNKLCRFAFVQLENTVTSVLDEANTGMLPELINLAVQYHDL